MKNLILILALTLFTACGDSPKPNTNSTPRPTTLTIQSNITIPAETKQGMIDSLNQLFTEARQRGYTQYLSLADYTIIVRNDCTPSPESGVMGWQEFVPGYGVIWQAEQVRISSNRVQSFQICNDVPVTMFNTTRYGAEHIILYFNDPAEFERTKIHTDASNVHPIIR